MEPDRNKFAEALGGSFTMAVAEGHDVVLELKEVSEIRERPHQQAFSIVFLAPESQFIEQGLYDLRHEGLGAMQLFLVPVGMKEGRRLLEAVFNTLKEA